MELRPEDVSLLERCPHFRGWYVHVYVLQSSKTTLRIYAAIQLITAPAPPAHLICITIKKSFVHNPLQLVHVCTITAYIHHLILHIYL